MKNTARQKLYSPEHSSVNFPYPSPLRPPLQLNIYMLSAQMYTGAQRLF